ncbi:putative membrane-associated kinase regulator 1 [Hibiscus syriacus]|uniref:Membrane-associated kinase regulator 1 n=1 Tax=Hibiscus syriacus TaxID=106335 RepID=A0A6A2XJY9_HIBSY|nr:leucine-rich repeat receptor-like serine/threonine-protein kinase At2g14510 [Hibiscus syriacus]KAE8662326.1 putative membrane-associated kinase regulator 1 [Hibiscus syriacus]
MAFPFLLYLSFLFLSLPALSLSQQQQQQPPKGYLIDCGAIGSSMIDGRVWLTDDGFISSGTAKNLTVPNLVPTLSTVRSFPIRNGLRRKFCYVARVYRGARYLIRSTYYYGGVNGLDFPSPPVFDQIVDGTFWSVVNTTEDYSKGLSSYYEGVFEAKGSTMSVCIASNTYTVSDPFISSLEMLILGGSLYNTTNFDSHALRLVARHSFGHNGSIIGYPDDQFDRYWEPYEENVSVIASNTVPSVSGFWNIPPSKVFERALSTARSESLELRWPPFSLPSSTYYIALYFADNGDSPASSREFDIHINDIRYYNNLIVGSEGAAVFATRWPLRGATKITLSPAADSNASPLINAGEIFDVLRLGGRTHTRDVIALEGMKNSLRNPPLDWSGDPCRPRDYSWTGVRCSEGERIRVISLNLTGIGLSGSLSPSIANLTALSSIWLGNNSLSGVIPDLSSLKLLETLHLEENQLTGEIPSSLGDIESLRELFLQNNNLTGRIPDTLVGRPRLEVRTSGNQFLTPPPS